MQGFTIPSPRDMSFARFAPAGGAARPQAAAAAVPAPSAAPAPETALAAVLAAPSAVDPVPAPAVEAPRFVGGRLRSLMMELGSPIEFAGRTYERVELRRPTSRQVREYFEDLVALGSSDMEATLLFPIYFDEWGDRLPEAVFDFLDDDDRQDLGKVARDFLPDRLRALARPGL